MPRRRSTSIPSAFAVWCTPFLIAASLAAQCEPRWQPGDPAAWLKGAAEATALWDPEGAGPEPLLLIVAGDLSGGSVLAGGLAAWDGARWRPLGDPPGTRATAVGVHQGRLVAALAARGDPGWTIAAFDGATWQNLGPPAAVTGGSVHAFATYNGELVAGGSFIAIGGQSRPRIARFDGAAWQPLGSGIGGGRSRPASMRSRCSAAGSTRVACSRSPVARRSTRSRRGTVRPGRRPATRAAVSARSPCAARSTSRRPTCSPAVTSGPSVEWPLSASSRATR